MKNFWLLFLSLNAFASDNYVSGPDARVVFNDKVTCEKAERKACYLKPEDHTITRIESGALVEDASKKAAKEKEKSELEAAIVAKIQSCDSAKELIVTLGDKPRADDVNSAVILFIKNCLM